MTNKKGHRPVTQTLTDDLFISWGFPLDNHCYGPVCVGYVVVSIHDYSDFVKSVISP